MITKEHFLMIVMLGTMMAAGLTACSGDDDTATNGNTPQTADDGVKVRRLTITEADGGAAIPVLSLSISYVGIGSDDGTYPPTATVSLKDADGVSLDQAAVHATGTTGTGALTVTCPSEQEAVYVALLPTTAQRTFSFNVSDGSDNTYTGTASATLAEGEYVAATGLKLTASH